MSDRFSIALLGLPALAARLAAAPALIERQVLDHALETAALQLRAFTRARIHRDTGRLAGTLNVKPLRPRVRRIGWSVWTGTRTQMGLRSRRNRPWYYPAHVHLGHATPYHGRLRTQVAGGRSSRKARRGHWVPAQPFLRDALLQNQATLMGTIARLTESGLTALYY